MKLLEVVVEHRWRVAQGIAGFELILPGGLELPSYEAGSHIDVHLPNGLVRQYSLCGDPQERMRWRIVVLRESASRGGSAALHDGVHVGDRLKVGVPRNLFALADALQALLEATLSAQALPKGACLAPALMKLAALAQLHQDAQVVMGLEGVDLV